MRRVFAAMYLTLDGCTDDVSFPGSDDPDGNEHEIWTGRYEEFGTLLLGRRAYEDWSKAWNTSIRKKSDPVFFHQHSRFVENVPKIVFSQTLTKPLLPNTVIERRAPVKVVADLKRQKGKDIAVGGGPMLTRTLMDADLIDEYFLTLLPVVFGQGPRLFGERASQLNLKLVKATTERSGVVMLHYRSANSPDPT
jgi:dihydrofolate reductase